MSMQHYLSLHNEVSVVPVMGLQCLTIGSWYSAPLRKTLPLLNGIRYTILCFGKVTGCLFLFFSFASGQCKFYVLKTDIWWLAEYLLMEKGMLHDYFGNFSTRGENIFAWRGACKVASTRVRWDWNKHQKWTLWKGVHPSQPDGGR